MNRIVLDASAVLALILAEPGGETVDALLDSIEWSSEIQVTIGSVNWCEILTRMQRENLGNSEERLASILSGVVLSPFGKIEAEGTAGLANVNRALSLGDRACLALAKSLGATAWTTERLWARCNLDVPIKLIRP